MAVDAEPGGDGRERVTCDDEVGDWLAIVVHGGRSRGGFSCATIQPQSPVSGDSSARQPGARRDISGRRQQNLCFLR